MLHPMQENFTEYSITEWSGARIRVVIESPGKNRTVTSMIVIDDHDLYELKNISPPEDLSLMRPEDAHMALALWEPKRVQAEKIIKMIAMKISHDLARELTVESK